MSDDKILYGIKNSLERGFTKLCCQLGNDASVDNEIFMGCDSVTGDPVIVTYGFNELGNLAITYTQLNGSPFVGNVIRCSDSTYQISNFQWFCEGNANQISRSDLYIDGVFSSYIWQNIAGAVISAPSPGNYKIGKCGVTDTQILPICYISGGGQLKGYMSVLKNSSGEIESTIFYDNQFFQLASGVILVDCEVNNKAQQFIPVDCYVTFDINGYPNLQHNGWLSIRYDSLGNIFQKELFIGDTETGAPLILVNASVIGCPELKCYTFDSIEVVGYQITIEQNSPLYPQPDFSGTYGTFLLQEDGTPFLDSFAQPGPGILRDCGCSEIAQSVKICSNEIYAGDMCYCNGSISMVATKLYTLENGAVSSQRFVDAVNMTLVLSPIFNCPHTCP